MMRVLFLFFTSLLVTIICGKNLKMPTTFDVRIVGGHAVDIEDYPYQISIMYIDSHCCGGSLIQPNVVLTVAHCVDGFKPEWLLVRAGSSFLNQGGEVKFVSNIYSHDNYDNKTYNNDIAILELSENFSIGPNIQLINLPNREDGILDGQMGAATGWGQIVENGPFPVELQEIDLPVINTDACNMSYTGIITDKMFCAGYMTGGMDACQGDSGGPFAVDGTLVGLISFGNGCARPEYPGVYTKVVMFLDFIDQIVNKINP